MAEIKRSLAVVIGINQYVNGIPMLKTAVNDATKVAHILETKYQYQVLLILDSAATGVELNNLFTALDQQIFPLPDGSNIQVDEDDRILFYFAGHGIALDALDHSDGPAGYLVPQDASIDNHSSLLPMTRLHNALLKLPCRHLLVILDCCFAGAFRWAGNREAVRRSKMYRERYERFISGYAQQVITSAADDEQSADSLYRFGQRSEHDGHSPFAELLLKALEGEADLSNDGVMTATELYVYLHSELGKTTVKQTPGFSQLKRHDKGEYIFAVPEFDHDNLKPAPPLDESNNPYRGLESFESEHSKLFYGRTNLIAKLLEFVSNQPLTVVLGASGTGKSSLVKAGLIPQLKDQQWRTLAPLRPGESPFTTLNKTLHRENLPVFQMPKEAFEQELQTLAQSVRAWSDAHPDTKLLLVIDQFEELVTMSRDDLEREKFLGGLARAIAAFPEQLRIVVTLRSDFEPQFQDTALKPYWQQARFIVPAMTRAELRSAIVEPATTRVMYFEPPTLVDLLIDEVVQMPGAMPLLSFTLSELYLKYIRSTFDGTRNNRAITQQDYEELGGVTRSLTQRADDEYTQLVKLDPAYAQTIKHLMLRMVAVGGGELARRQVLCTELEYPEPENTRVKLAIEHFVAARLLVKGRNIENQEYIEPAHDFLVRGWQRLRTWKDKELGSLLLQRELTLIAHKWCMEKQNKKATGFLWDQDPRLPFVRQVFESSYNWLNTVELEFVKCSIKQKEQNRLRTFTVVAGTFALVLGFAFIQWSQKQDIQVKNLLASSEVDFVSNRQLEALLKSLNAAKQLQQLKWLGMAEVETQRQVVAELGSMIYWVREFNRLEGHTNQIKSVSFSPQGNIIASASDDRTVKLWQLDGKLLRSFTGHTDAVNSVSFSPQGNIIASASNDRTVKVWQVDGKLLRSFTGHTDAVTSVSFSPQGNIIASASSDRTVKLWQVDGTLLRTLTGHTDAVNSVSFSPQGNAIASASRDRTIKLWQVDGKLLRTLTGHKDVLNSVSFSPDGQMIASGSEDKTVKLWKRDGKLLKTWIGHSERIHSVSFSPQGNIVASASHDNTVKLWDTTANKEITTLSGHSNSVLGISFNPNGSIIASASEDKTVKLWKLNSTMIKILAGHQSAVLGVNFSPQGSTIASASWDKTVKLWKRDGTLLTTLSGHSKPVYSVSFSPNPPTPRSSGGEGGLIASASADKTVKLWKRDGTLLTTLSGHNNEVYDVSFSPQGNVIASASGDQTVKLWNLDGTILRTLRGHTAAVASVSFSPDGEIIASASNDRTVKLWKLDGSLLRTLTGRSDTVRGVSFSPDGEKIALASWDKTIALYKRNGNSPYRIMDKHTDAVWDVKFSPQGSILASASRDKTVKIWQRDGTLLTTLSGHKAGVWDVSFSPDGKTLASASDDGTVILWNLEQFELDILMRRGCDWVRDYLNNYAKLSPEYRHLCDDVN